MDFLLGLLLVLIAYLLGAVTVALVVIWRAMQLDAIDMATTIEALRDRLRVNGGDGT
jgi:hypothetical protein